MFDTLAYYSSVLYRHFTHYTGEKLQALGLNYGSLFFLIYVGKHPGCTPSELTKALRVDWGHSQRSGARLVEDGFMTKERAGRTHRLNLTAKGEQAFELSHQVFFDWDAQRLSVLTQAERDELFALLRKVAAQRTDDWDGGKGCEAR